ncbi:MAG: hypothetical protein GX542_12130, partial [Rhodococcus sp.]|nr:hypothetical protein [Rhodococcus sp. (in: high G+C Gram-positive bacteria)]
QSLLVRRRGADDLVLTTAARAAQQQAAASLATRMFVALIRLDPHSRVNVADVVREVFPWVAFLSEEELHTFIGELVETMRAAESLDNPAPVVHLIDAWRHTAEVLADPELAAILSADSDGDFGPTPAPQAE